MDRVMRFLAPWRFLVLVGAFVLALAASFLLLGPGSEASAASPSRCEPSPTFPAVTAGRSAPGTVAPSTGVLRAGLLTVDFPNAVANYPAEEHLAPVEQAAAWYRTVSGGRLTLAVTGLDRWLRLPLRSEAYAQDPSRYFAHAIAAADPYFDFTQVDVVYLVPVEGAIGWESLSSAVLNSFGVHADGKEVRFWVAFSNGSGRADPYPWLLIHETGHLLGLPDLYTPRAPSSFHRWDVMAGRFPAELFAWHRWKLGWLDPTQVVCVTGRADQRVTLEPLGRSGGLKAILVRRGNEVVVAEVRERLGYDAGLCRPGVLVYRVNTTPLRRTPVQLFSALSTPRSRLGQCGQAWNATFRVGSSFWLAAWRLRVSVLARLQDGSYRVRVNTR
jgi:M6 family metalloprotease-like protein